MWNVWWEELEEWAVRTDVEIEVAGESAAREFRRSWALDVQTPPQGLELEEWYELLSLDHSAQRLVAAAIHLYRPDRLSRRDINLPEQLVAAADAEHAKGKELIESLNEIGTDEQDWDAIERAIWTLLPTPETFKERFLRAAVQAELARRCEFIPNLHDVSDRLLVLVNYLTRDPDPKVRAYLSRVARCFLLDMVPECCLMARAVMEVALEKRLPAGYVRTVRGIPSNRRIPLDVWINEAAADRIFDEAAEAAAKRVAATGGAVAHGKALDEIDAESVLADLHRVITALERLA